MALFGSKEKKQTSKSIRPTVVRTQNVAKELQILSKSYEVSLETLDFNILDTQTYIRINDGTKETEWGRIKNEDLYELDDESALLNPHFQIKQTYEIEIFSISGETPTPCPNLKVAVGANATKCKVYLSILKGSFVSKSSTLGDDLLNTINKKKIRAGILIHIFDEMVGEVISKISAEARIHDKVEFKESKAILIAEGLEPTATLNDKLILHYEEKKTEDENQKVDYASRGFIQSVKKDELLIEYIKPRAGMPGRNCRGDFLEPTEPIVANEVTFNIDSTIREIDTGESVEYRANENGYIAFADNTYTIKTDMDVGEISFKTTGSINSGVDSDVSLNVSETNLEKDAIGTGMSVEVTEIDIDGNVGSNAKVVALRATVGGQTHKTATLKADELDINVHKGKAYGKHIKVTRLEHGEIDGDVVEVSQALGGKIKAKEIDIEICASHVHATASKRIEIQKLQGSENIFTINPVVKKDANDSLNDNQETIKEIEKSLREIAKEIERYKKLIDDGMPAFIKIKKHLVRYKKNGVKLPASFVKKYKDFTAMQEHLKEIQSEYEVKNDQLSLQTTITVSFGDNIMDARVINRDRWIGYNEIRFKLVDPPMELVFKPQEGSKDKIFGLVDVGDGEFAIKAVEE
ncbi:MAG: FapA family protein [Sulfurimonas sp.]|nr:FapA family protein [Sulfurimonas sp.]